MRFYVWLLIGLLGLAACAEEAEPIILSPTAQTTPRLAPTESPPATPEKANIREEAETSLPNLIIQVDGELFVRHEGAASDQRIPLGVGARVTVGDSLYVAEGETAVFCGAESLWANNPRRFDPGQQPVGVPCLSAPPPLPAPDISQLRGEIDITPDESLSGYVLRPRGGWVSEERPYLRWQRPANTQTITLTLLSDDNLYRPPVVVTGSESAYPEEWEPLQADGAGYRLQISGSSNSAGFSLLETEEITQLHRQTAQIEAQIGTEPGRTLVLAELLMRHELWSEAVDLLLALPNGGEGETAVQQRLGEAYLHMGLFNEAQTALNQSLVAAQRSHLPEAEARAHYLLGWATCGLGQISETQNHWEAALEKYRALEIEDAIAEISEQLSGIEENCRLPEQKG